jgi:multiple sugar transport system substrate-binding protein
MKNFLALCVLPILIALTVAGCGAGAQQSGEKAAPVSESSPTSGNAQTVKVDNDPVTISILNWNGMTDEEFQRYYVGPVSKKHPNITLQLVKKEAGKPAEAIAKHLMNGNFPDLIFVSNKDINDFLLAEVVYPLDDMVKQHRTDLKRFIAPAIESLRNRTKDGGLVSIPWAQNVGGLFYSPDIFDKFGVPYPKDLMTWDETLALARKLTRTENNVQYLGMIPSSLSQFGQSFSVSYVSADGKALIDTPEWKRALGYYKDLYAIPGYAGHTGSMFGTKTVAMQPNWVGSVYNSAVKDPDYRWDVVGIPNFAELLGTGREVDAHTLAISTTGKHKEQAFQVIETVTSDEVQADMSRYGRVPVLDNVKILSDFGASAPPFSGKNWKAMFAVKPGPLRKNSTPYDSILLGLINPLQQRIQKGETDINTLLREVQEDADKALQAAMQ